jgi:hypothetical protein
MAEPEPICRGDRAEGNVACRHGRLDRCGKQRIDALGYRLEQLARIFAILEKAVQQQAQADVEIGPVDLASEHQVPNHVIDHTNQRRRRGLARGQALEPRITVAAEPQNLAVEDLLARKVPEQQPFGNARRLGEFLGRRPGKAFASEQRDGGGDNRLAPLVAVQSDRSHGG